MKYGNNFFRFLLVVLSVCLLYACGGQQVKTNVTAEKTFELMPTLEYLPVAKKGDDGKYLPYESMPNPYLTRGRIKKGSVAAYIEARKAFKSRNYDEAKQRLNVLTQEDDSISGPWVLLGDIEMENKDHVRALEAYNRAININKNNVNAWLRIAYVQRLQGQYLAAQNTYVDLLNIWKDCPEAHLNLAVLYDIYLNLPIRSQKHMEAYLYLTQVENKKVVAWLTELHGRTGVAVSLPIENLIPDQSLLVSK